MHKIPLFQLQKSITQPVLVTSGSYFPLLHKSTLAIRSAQKNLNGYDLFDNVNNMLCDLSHNYNGGDAVVDEFTVLEPVGHEIIRRYKERICNIRTLISRELLDGVYA